MSHNLNIAANGQYSFFASTKKYGLPWHELGQLVDGAKNWQDAMRLANLNWSVSKRPLYAKIPRLEGTREYREIAAWGIFRDDTNEFLGSVGDVYETIQNLEAFSFVDALLEAQNGAHFETAGALGNGERIFATAEIPYSIAPARAPDDKTNCFLLFETSHDGSLAASAKLTTIRVVCNNTLSMALSERGYGTLKVRHSESGHDKLERAKKLITGVQQSVETLKEKFNVLSRRKITAKISNEVMNKLFGADWKDSTRKTNQVAKIAEIFDHNDGNAFPQLRGTAYNLLQACTNFSDHERTVRQTEGKSGMSTEALQAESALFGTGELFKSRALEYILAETETADLLPDTPIVAPVATTTAGKANLDNILSMVNV